MKLLPCLFLIACATLNAQTALPTVKAKGGGGKNVDWPKIQKEEDSDKTGPGFFYRDCSQGVTPLVASSTLPAQGTKKYDIDMLADSNPMTAWVEGKKGYGIGEWFEIEAYNVTVVFNGYQATPLTWKNNSRVKRFKVYVNGKALCFLDLTDEMGQQNFDLPIKNISPEKNLKFRFEIVDVYKGLKWDDVAISHIDNEGCCVGASSLVSANNLESRIESISGSIDSINIDNGNVGTVPVAKVKKQWHNDVFLLKTKQRELILTRDHPLYFKAHGFSSLKQLEKTSTSDLLSDNAVEIMVIENGISHYERIISITEVPGQWMYSVETIVPASYLVNGIVTKTYVR